VRVHESRRQSTTSRGFVSILERAARRRIRAQLQFKLLLRDICHADLVHAMIDDRNDNYQAVPRGSNLPKRPEHTLTRRGSQFRDALYDWRTETATGLFGALDFWPADLLLHEEILEDIVVFVDSNKIVSLQDLQRSTSWILWDQYGDQIISLVHRFFPPAPLRLNAPPPTNA